MHLIIPYASSCSDGCGSALPSLQLPHLQKLLARLSPLPPDQGDEQSLSTPNERALARAFNLPFTDGLIPWAALQARKRPELATQGTAWSFITLCHWQVNTQNIAMSHLPLPELQPEQSDALMRAMQPYFEEDHISLHADQCGRWLAQSDVFASIATASIDRVVGRNLDGWMPSVAQAAPLRRLQNEMQMLFYSHPVYDQRVALGLPPVNSFWFSGTGALPHAYTPPASHELSTVLDSLRAPALAENWPDWKQAWQELDARQISALLQAAIRSEPVRITLCGERNAQIWQTQPKTLLQKFKAAFGSQHPSTVLEQL
jgi:hypothetical protein